MYSKKPTWTVISIKGIQRLMSNAMILQIINKESAVLLLTTDATWTPRCLSSPINSYSLSKTVISSLTFEKLITLRRNSTKKNSLSSLLKCSMSHTLTQFENVTCPGELLLMIQSNHLSVATPNRITSWSDMQLIKTSCSKNPCWWRTGQTCW